MALHEALHRPRSCRVALAIRGGPIAVRALPFELRAIGCFWRRRIPVRARTRFKPEFFCFPLRAQAPRDVAEFVRRRTAVSEICFTTEKDMPSEVRTEILVACVESVIKISDRLRAMSGPRTRESDVAMTLEQRHAACRMTRETRLVTPSGCRARSASLALCRWSATAMSATYRASRVVPPRPRSRRSSIDRIREWPEYEHKYQEPVAAIDEAARGCAWHPGRLA